MTSIQSFHVFLFKCDVIPEIKVRKSFALELGLNESQTNILTDYFLYGRKGFKQEELMYVEGTYLIKENMLFSFYNKAFSEFLASQQLELMFKEMMKDIVAFHAAPTESTEGIETLATTSVWHSYVIWALTHGKLLLGIPVLSERTLCRKTLYYISMLN